MKKYHLVDFAAQYQVGFRNNVVPIQEVPKLVEKYKHYECYCTYFFYTDEILAFMSTHEKDAHPTLGGYAGKVWAPFFPIDIDAQKLTLAQKTAQQILEFLTSEGKIKEEEAQVYFSGCKGFHILLDVRLFGRLSSSSHLHQIFDTFRHELIDQIPGLDRTQIDLTLKDKFRLLRLPNTINKKTNLYKIQLSFSELMEMKTPQIIARAKDPAEIHFTDQTGLISKIKKLEENDLLAGLFERSQKLVKRFTKKPFHYHFKPPQGESPESFLCLALLKMWQAPVPLGRRNNCAFRLASDFRLNGLEEEKAKDLLFGWNEKYQIGLSHQELMRTIHSAYAPPYPYHYGCRDSIIEHFCPFAEKEKCNFFPRLKKLG